MIMSVIWLIFFATRLVAIVLGGQTSWWGWASLAGSGVLVVGYLPSIIFFMRNRETHPSGP